MGSITGVSIAAAAVALPTSVSSLGYIIELHVYGSLERPYIQRGIKEMNPRARWSGQVPGRMYTYEVEEKKEKE